MSNDEISRQNLPVEAAEYERLAVMGELLPELAHEIRNLMQVVTGFIEIELKRNTFSEITHRRLQKSMEQAAFASELTGSLLRFARPNDDTSGDAVEALNLVLDLFRHRQRKGIPLELLAAAATAPVQMPTGYLQLVFANIIKNAFDAMDQCAGGHISASITSNVDRVQIRIYNSGPHIPASVLPHLFSKFTGGKARENGLGLHIAHRLITQAGGTISVENVFSGGVSFQIELPKATAIPNPDTGRSGTVQLNGARLMIVDDDRIVRDVLQLMIAEIGGSVVQVCGSGDDALKAITRTNCDAVLLDLRMKGLSGREVYEHFAPAIKKRVIFVTGENLDRSAQSFLNATTQPVLLKPVKLTSLVEAVKRVQFTAPAAS